MAAMGYKNASPVSTHTSSSSSSDTTSTSTSGGGTHPMEDTQKFLTNCILYVAVIAMVGASRHYCKPQVDVML
eukprot:2030128-Ditylum_brightwellii.AAC.2